MRWAGCGMMSWFLGDGCSGLDGFGFGVSKCVGLGWIEKDRYELLGAKMPCGSLD